MLLKKSFFRKLWHRIQQTGSIPLYMAVVLLVILLAIFQDYLYSRLQDTGFYLSESLLYNTIWVFFIPGTLLVIWLTKRRPAGNTIIYTAYTVFIGALISFLHILLFAASFVMISRLIYSPSHHFSHIFRTAMSNQFYLVLLYYCTLPVFYRLFFRTGKQPSAPPSAYPEKINLKNGPNITAVDTSSIQLIATDRPYSVVYTQDQKYLQDKSLKEFENDLDPTRFLRVHRSSIINAAAVKSLKSRKNGDYDAVLHNGQIIRLSRHFRDNWQQLLH